MERWQKDIHPRFRRDILANEPPDDWFSRMYKRFYGSDLMARIAAALLDAGFLYRTLSSSTYLVTYRFQWRFWRGAYWMFDAAGRRLPQYGVEK